MSTTLERIHPKDIDTQNELDYASYKLHIERYAFASGFIKESDQVFDMACGVGYGSEYIAKQHPNVKVKGIDISENAISYAKKNYSAPNIEFTQANILEYENSIRPDVIVSLETVEHLEQPGLFIEKVSKILKPNGMFIVSVPITPSLDFNPFHLQDFTEKSIKELVQKNGFTIIDQQKQIQPIDMIQLLFKKDQRIKISGSGLIDYYKKHPGYIFTRAKAILIHGFRNKYVTLALQRTGKMS